MRNGRIGIGIGTRMLFCLVSQLEECLLSNSQASQGSGGLEGQPAPIDENVPATAKLSIYTLVFVIGKLDITERVFSESTWMQIDTEMDLALPIE